MPRDAGAELEILMNGYAGFKTAKTGGLKARWILSTMRALKQLHKAGKLSPNELGELLVDIIMTWE